MSFNPAVGRQESMRWAAPEHAYDGGDWEDDIDERDEENLGDDDVASILSADLAVGGDDEPADYRNIYEYYEDDDPKRRSVQEQLEEEIYQSLTPGHSRHTSVDSQIEVDPSIAELYQGTSQYLARPISVYADTQPLSLGTSESDRHINAILTGIRDDETPTQTPVATTIPPLTSVGKRPVPIQEVPESSTPSVASEAAKEPHSAPVAEHATESEASHLSEPQLEPKADHTTHNEAKEAVPELHIHTEPEPQDAPPHVPEPTYAPPEPLKTVPEVPEVPEDSEPTPPHSPSLAALAITPSKLPINHSDDDEEEEKDKEIGKGEAETSEEHGFPSLNLTCATPEGSDNEDDREKPDWKPRWRPETETKHEEEKKDEHTREIEDGLNGVQLHESQISLDMSDSQSLQSRQSFVQSDLSERSTRSKPSIQSGFVDSVVDSGSETDTGTIEAPSLDEDTHEDTAAHERDAEPAEPAARARISSRVSRAPVIDMKAVFGLNTSSQRQKALIELREREAEYSTQLETWLRSTYDESDKSSVYVTGSPPEAETHALPVSRQVGTALGQSGTRTKETLVKVGDRGKKGLNAMKKLMRH